MTRYNSETAIADWLAEIAPDARVTDVTTDEADTDTLRPQCETCFGVAEVLSWDRYTEQGTVLTVDVTVETADPGYEPSALLGEGGLKCCLGCRDEYLSRANAVKLAKTGGARVGLRRVS